VRDVTGRLQTDRVVSAPRPQLAATLRDGVAIRQLNGATVLPLADETVYVSTPGFDPSGELARPSSTQAVFSASGADTGARILTLRPRAATDWLARVQTIPDGRFADGSTLLGIGSVRHQGQSAPGRLAFNLYWRLPGAPEGTRVAERMVVTGQDAMGAPRIAGMLPAMAERREDEIVVKGWGFFFRSQQRAYELEIGLRDASGAVIPTASGAPSLRVTLRGIRE
jgi:hypothetical protein